MLNRRWVAVMVGLSLCGSPALAQEIARGQYSVAVVGGSTRFDKSSALKNDFMRSLYGGVEANYHVRTHLSAGFFLLASRPTTDGSMFPMNRLVFRTDTVIYYLASQQLTLLEGGVQGSLNAPLGPVRLLGTGGVGLYRIDLDQQRAKKPVRPGTEVTNMTGMSLIVGGGLSIPLPGGGGLRLQVRDFIYTDYDREALSIAEPLLSSVQIPHPNPNPPDAKETIHNLRFEAGFTFRPSTGGFGGGL